MSKRSARDNLLLYAVGIALAVLAAGFAGAWLYLRHAERTRVEIHYLNLPDLAISRDGHSVKATIAIRTSGVDADWAADHKHALEAAMKDVLMTADPQRVRAHDGIRALQDKLKAASKAALRSDKVQEVLITDFLVSEGDL